MVQSCGQNFEHGARERNFVSCMIAFASISLLLIATGLCVVGVRQLKLETRLPWLVFVGSYVASTVIGATLTGMPDGLSILKSVYPNLDMEPIRGGVTLVYWTVLYCPIIIITGLLLVFDGSTFPWERTVIRVLHQMLPNTLNITNVILVTAILSLYSFALIFSYGYGLNAVKFLSGSLDYQTAMLLRLEMMQLLARRGVYFYEVIYIGLPMLSWIALFSFIKTRKFKWLILFAVQSVSISILVLTTIQKAPLLVYFLGTLISLLLLQKIRFVGTAVFGLLGLTALTFLQYFFLNKIDFFAAFIHSVFRVSQSFIYYLSIYPHLEEYQAFNFGLGLLGIETVINDNIVVASYMESSMTWTTNMAAGSSFVRAYSHGGFFPTSVVSILTFLVIHAAGKLVDVDDNPLLFAVKVQLCITLYYLTQTSFYGALLESYGLIWALPPMVLLILVHMIQRLRWSTE